MITVQQTRHFYNAKHVPQTFVKKILSTQLHKIVIQTKNYKYLLPYWIEPLSSQDPRWRSLVPETTIVTDSEKPITHEQTRIGPSRPQPDNQSETVFNNQSELGILNQSGRSIFALTKYYLSVTNTYDWSQKITLIIFWLSKNGKDKIRTPHWSKK